MSDLFTGKFVFLPQSHASTCELLNGASLRHTTMGGHKQLYVDMQNIDE